MLLGVYVDDLIITDTTLSAINEFKAEMMSLFKMSDLGILSYYLGIKVVQKPGRIFLGKAAYVEKMLDKMGMENCNSAAVPMETRLKLSKKGRGTAMDATLYQSVVGGLCYLTTSSTRSQTSTTLLDTSAGSWRCRQLSTGMQSSIC
jgi:hypothetical protein